MTTGRWAEGKTIDGKVIIGTEFLTVGLAALGEMSPDLAQNFALLILVVAALRYVIPIVSKTGIAPNTGGASVRSGIRQ